MSTMAGEVRRAAEYVQHAPINVCASERAEIFVHPFRLLSCKVGDLAKPQVAEVSGDARPDAGDDLEILRARGGFS